MIESGGPPEKKKGKKKECGRKISLPNQKIEITDLELGREREKKKEKKRWRWRLSLRLPANPVIVKSPHTNIHVGTARA